MSVDKLRGSKHINRIAPSDVGLLMSAQSYRPEITQAIRKIKSLNWSSLQELVVNTISPGPHPKYGGSYPCLKTKNVDGLLATHEPADYADSSVFKDLNKVTVKEGDLLINLTGAGSIGRVSVYYGKDKPITNQHIARMSVKTGTDEGYLACFLRSWWGERALEQGVAGSTGQINMVNEHVRSIPVYLPDPQAQKYIGDKVRQAEQLRAWAKKLERSLDVFVEHFQPEKKEYKKLFSRVPNNLLTNMLTATTYREKYIANQKHLKDTSITHSVSYYLSSVTNGFDERNEIESGLPYVKVADIRAGYIDFKNSPRVRLSALADASTKQKPQKGDLLLTRKGSFGIAAVVMESTKFLCSSEVFSCKPSRPEYMPILSWFLNSEAGNMQFWQFSTGTTMPGINQENLQNILIPDFSECDIELFNSIHETRYEAKKCAELLTNVAKNLVEALIEGKLTEQQLMQAQQALDDGDNSLDQAILSKLSNEGYAVEGTEPLFSDIEELYRLLESAAEAEE